LPVPPLAVLPAEGAAALKGFVDCVAVVVRSATDLGGGTGVPDAGESLDIRLTQFVSDSVARSLNLLTFASSSGALAVARNAFWINQLVQPETVAMLKGATLEFGELTCLEHVGRSLQSAATCISGARNTALAGQLAAATAATAAATTAAAAAASALAMASTGGGAAGAGGTRAAACPSYTIHALSDLGSIRTNALRPRFR
jgi:hypothetical protein